MIIDDGSADFFPGPCWTFAGGSQSYNNGYHRAASDGEDNCTSRWTIRRDAFTEPGEYDVFVHIPPDANPSLSVAYDVHHNNQVSRAIAVQAAYVYNEEHDAWVYLGRYDFAMSDNVTEFVLVHDHDVFDEDDGRYTLADAIMLAPAGEEASLPPPQRYFYVSFSQDGYAGNVPYADEDVLLFDAHTGEWRMFVDGSDVGLSSVDVDAFAYKSDNLYFSTGQSFGGGGFTNADIIHFAPTSLGEETSGTMSIYLTGEKVGLTEDDDIDALAFNGQGDVLLSVKDPVTLNGNDFEDEDLFVEDPDNPGGATLFFDGSAKQLNDYSEDVDGVWLAPGNDIYLSTEGTFAVSGSGTSGDGTDIFICSPGFTGDCLYGPGLFWNGSAHGVGTTATVDDFFVHDNYLIDDCQTFGNGGFEGQFYCWERTIFPNPIEGEWRPTTVDKHSGQYSAEARIEVIYNQTPTIFLTSSPIPVEESTAYRFRFWAKTIADAPYENMQVYASIYWYSENTYQEEEFADIDYSEYPEWTQLTSGFLCPPSHEVNSARIVFALVSHTLFGTTNDGVGSIFIDDVMWESQPCNPDLVRKLKC